MKKICVITGGYPTPMAPEKYTFVDQLVCAWADTGVEIFVICPIPIFVEMKDRTRFYKSSWVKTSPRGVPIYIYHPRYFSTSNRQLFGLPTIAAADRSFCQAVLTVIRHNKLIPDILYAHFLSTGYCAAELGNALGISSFCAFGESSLWSIENRSLEQVRAGLQKLMGIISVSSENKRILLKNRLFREKDIVVLPNGVNHELFHPYDKQAMRKKFGFSSNDIIGVFTGAFNESKGVLRAQAAALNAGGIKMIFIGGGELTPKGENILFQGKLPHSEIPYYLSAANFFILPTKAEGCSNAIIEAMSCGLPVISSNGAFNDDILSDEYSIRTNPEDIIALSSAIRLLCENPEKRENMAISALKASRIFDINIRAKSILDYMDQKAKNK